MHRLLLAAALSLAVLPASAGELVESYFARLSAQDHFNTKGQRLTDVAAIIRQDRANFHAFGLRDSDDQSDGYFASKANRARLEAMIRAGAVTGPARAAIVNGTPLIYVEIFTDHVNVALPE